ncbi:MAG TPA: hypothetical protein VLA54_10345 [Acidimicrobiia bacterium]|nr:hypothetical protein [Acidimicrobiia bacterium]
MKLEGEGIRVDLPPGWEGEIGPSAPPLEDGAVRNMVAHFASFPLPARRGDFGGGAVDLMGSSDAFVALFEYGREAAGTALFAAAGAPARLESGHFDRSVLQRPVPLQSAVQRFFTATGRAFCLYVVVGSHVDRADVLPAINQLLGSLVIE